MISELELPIGIVDQMLDYRTGGLGIGIAIIDGLIVLRINVAAYPVGKREPGRRRKIRLAIPKYPVYVGGSGVIIDYPKGVVIPGPAAVIPLRPIRKIRRLPCDWRHRNQTHRSCRM